ncbi:MAG TPA: tetratricopeptide repeat protein [Gaiellaceae bacterium]|nr:tetratricopeptide repeat protein [Gaiellaceae bacterium]
MSPHARAIVLVAAIAVGAAGVTVAGALIQGRDTGGEVHGRTETSASDRRERPTLELAILDRGDAEARALRRAERLYEAGRADAAERAFRAVLERNSASVEAEIGAAVASWPDGTLERLRALVEREPRSGVARLNLGLALLAAGDLDEARRAWREAERRDPDSAAALRAEDLLNPDMPPGRPRFVFGGRVPPALARLDPEARLARLARGARSGEPRDWLLYGVALESVGRRVSARAAYDRAVALAPGEVEPRVAAAVSRFDKDRPAAAFSRLGPLARASGGAPVVRFHLGLLLLWLPNVDEARRQLRLAAAGDRNGFYRREAARLLARLDEVE